MNISANGYYTAYKFDLQDLCRICGTTSNDLNSMFDDNGSAYDFASKINEYLPITVRKSDYLPQKICSMCATTLLSFHQLYIICQSNNTRFLQSLEGEAYEHHVVKNHAVGDASELLELQSSFSREIENEIFNMHESKEIFEAESEIAANAAVKELERIGSAENISLVEEVTIDVINSIVEDVKPETLNNSKKSTTTHVPAANQNASQNEKKPKNKAKKEPNRRQIKAAEKSTTKAKPKANATSTSTAIVKAATTVKSRTVKSPKKSVKTPKTEILKENVTRAKSRSTERNTPAITTNGNDVKENSCIGDDDDVDDTQRSPKENCDYCTLEFTSKSLLIDHIKDAHNDLIFHCEMCDDYVARVDLISHMLNHALNPSNGTTVDKMENVDKKTTPQADTNADDEEMSTVKPTPSKKKATEKLIANSSKIVKKNGEHPESAPIHRELEKSDIEKPNQSKTTVKSAKATTAAKNPRAQHYCTECDKQFVDSGGFKYHINSFHKKIKKYVCDICGNHFSCKRVITNHLRGVHMKERTFECSQCAKTFSTDSALYMHKKIHENIFKCVCHICGSKFRSKSKLKIHMTMHTKEKNYFCPVCTRGFAVRNNLTKHMLTHSKVYDFKCDKCSYVANQRRYLAEHIKRSHKT